MGTSSHPIAVPCYKSANLEILARQPQSTHSSKHTIAPINTNAPAKSICFNLSLVVIFAWILGGFEKKNSTARMLMPPKGLKAKRSQ